MYTLIRTLIWMVIVALAVVALCIFFRKKNPDKRMRRISIVFTVIFCFAISAIMTMIPLENSLITFTTPEAVFNYMSPGEVMKDIVYGKESCMIISNEVGKEDNPQFLVVKGSGNSYKIGIGGVGGATQSIEVKTNRSSGVRTHIFRATDTDDYYLFAFLYSEKGEPSISDESNSEFTIMPINEANAAIYGFQQYLAYGYISDVNSDYRLLLGGDTRITTY